MPSLTLEVFEGEKVGNFIQKFWGFTKADILKKPLNK